MENSPQPRRVALHHLDLGLLVLGRERHLHGAIELVAPRDAGPSDGAERLRDGTGLLDPVLDHADETLQAVLVEPARHTPHHLVG
ncbi:MAG: hypothetical protein E4H37_07740 [Gemmatimonadales bacterium]|nr:MAG: hypothetical protein E4H37_07740 [Gemmatimonadales bacterium]